MLEIVRFEDTDKLDYSGEGKALNSIEFSEDKRSVTLKGKGTFSDEFLKKLKNDSFGQQGYYRYFAYADDAQGNGLVTKFPRPNIVPYTKQMVTPGGVLQTGSMNANVQSYAYEAVTIPSAPKIKHGVKITGKSTSSGQQVGWRAGNSSIETIGLGAKFFGNITVSYYIKNNSTTQDLKMMIQIGQSEKVDQTGATFQQIVVTVPKGGAWQRLQYTFVVDSPFIWSYVYTDVSNVGVPNFTFAGLKTEKSNGVTSYIPSLGELVPADYPQFYSTYDGISAPSLPSGWTNWKPYSDTFGRLRAPLGVSERGYLLHVSTGQKEYIAQLNKTSLGGGILYFQDGETHEDVYIISGLTGQVFEVEYTFSDNQKYPSNPPSAEYLPITERFGQHALGYIDCGSVLGAGVIMTQFSTIIKQETKTITWKTTDTMGAGIDTSRPNPFLTTVPFKIGEANPQDTPNGWSSETTGGGYLMMRKLTQYLRSQFFIGHWVE